jgi:hypothetical protein
MVVSEKRDSLDLPLFAVKTLLRTYIDGCATRRVVALRRRIFKWKKGFANLILGLFFHSRALPQPPSRDTIPLSSVINVKILGLAPVISVIYFTVLLYIQHGTRCAKFVTGEEICQ